MNKVIILTAALALMVSSGAQKSLAQDQEPGTTALLIIDIQDFYFPGGSLPLVDPEPAAACASRLLSWFRSARLPVVHVGHNASQGKDFYAAVAPRKGEKVYFKDEVSAFKGSDLAKDLRDSHVKRLVICGMQTQMCLEGAVRAAADLGFDVVVVEDACATRDLKYGDRTVSAADVQASTLATLAGVYAKVMTCDEFLKTAPQIIK